MSSPIDPLLAASQPAAHRPKRGEAKGFTLIEITIAVAILGTMLFVGYSALSNISWGKKTLDDDRELRLVAQSVVTRLARELQLSFGQIPLLPPEDNLQKPYPARVVFIGTPGTGESEAPADSITFMALEGGQYLPDGGRHSGVVQVTYRLVADPNDPRGKGAPLNLVRQETPHIRPPQKAYSKTMTFPITNAATALQFRFYDDNTGTWVDSWGKDGREGLPRLVQVALTLNSPGGKTERFMMIVAIRSAAKQ
jgi:prepilin-type N-terminal cleavage/methylation domain-containing protein